MKMVFGVTGILGSGKSSVAKKLHLFGACVVDMDAAGRWAVEHDEHVQQQMKEAFGREMFDEQKRLLRIKLGDIVFSNPAALATLNRIVHPPMLERARFLIEREKRRPECLYIVIDAALLFELGFEHECDFVVCVTAPIEQCVERAVQFKNMTSQNARERIQSQLSQEEKASRSDYIVLNSSDLNELNAAIRKLHKWILAKIER